MTEPVHIELKKLLAGHGILVEQHNHELAVSWKSEVLVFCVKGEFSACDPGKACIHVDQLITAPGKIAAMVLARLKMNRRVFARNCKVKRVDKTESRNFLEAYHLMGSAQSAYNLGLYHAEELIALATFSKGRKMRRLPEHQRSFELIRFCCKEGITVTGGLTKLVKTFCSEKNAGDIMTYIDKEWSGGQAFLKAGFRKLGETAPNCFLVNRTTYERTPAEREEAFDHKQYYLSCNSGNLKLVYTPGE